MPRVVFTSSLQRHVTCAETQVAAGTLREALAQVFAAQPQVRDYIVDEQGELRKHVVVFIDGARVRDRAHLSDPVREASEIHVLQALTGG
jgi:sulfur-carrier protein